MNELSLFTGIGGGLLGTKLLGWRSIGYVEINEYCRRVLEQRIKDGILDDAPIFGDIQEFNRTYAGEFKGMVDVITAGFPCQPFSVAGKRQGADDERNMWPATIECIRKIRPRYTLLENVPGLLTSGYFGTILRDLAESGYDCRWRCLSAAEVGAPHLRDRLWIMAYFNNQGLSEFKSSGKKQQGRIRPDRVSVCHDWGTSNPSQTFIRRGLPGIPKRIQRIKAIGNAQVPAVVKTVWELLNEE